MNQHQTILQIISDNLGVEVEEIIPEQEFILDLNATPQEMSNIKEALEAEFEITLPEFEEDNPQTVADLIDLVDDITL